MNVEAYNLDSLRALIRSIQDENLRLKALLDQANVAYETADIFDKKLDCIEAYDPDQGGRILDTFITKELANQFFSMFWGRTDVYARRGAKGGYFPQCNNRDVYKRQTIISSTTANGRDFAVNILLIKMKAL